MNIKELAEKVNPSCVFESAGMKRGKESMKYFADQYNRGQGKKEIVQNMQTDLEDSGLDSVKADKVAALLGDVFDALKSDKRAKTSASDVEVLFKLAMKGKLKDRKLK